jgi:hypothetical protein
MRPSLAKTNLRQGPSKVHRRKPVTILTVNSKRVHLKASKVLHCQNNCEDSRHASPHASEGKLPGSQHPHETKEHG